MHRAPLFIAAAVLAWAAAGASGAGPGAAGEADAPLPPGARVVWDLEKARRETTPTRERVCLNGLWRWQPAGSGQDAAPAGRWGYFKVPGSWPGITDYMQKDSQTVHAHPSWRGQGLREVTAAWYQREFTVPVGWRGRRIVLQAEYVNSLAVVFVDGRRAGEIRFPAGEAELTAACRPGGRHLLSLLVFALPLKGVMLSHSDTNAAREAPGVVARRGLCGDLFLAGLPSGARLGGVRVETSVARGEVALHAGLEALRPEARYGLRAEIRERGRAVRAFASAPFRAADLRDGRLTLREKWRPAKLWDLHTPGHMYEAQLTLREIGAGGIATRDVGAPERFGFREFRIAGRDFYLNGSRVFLSAVPLDNAQAGAALASYAAARESLERLKSIGINFVYTHNYGCEPGSHLSFAEILRAADDAGMLVALSQPHFAHYDWKSPDADRDNGYAEHASFYARAAGNHPSVVAYATSHNATGYGEDMNPDMIDGRRDPREPYALNNARLALRAEALIRASDPGRVIYHHSSGNLGSMHTVNFYANFAPVQEMSDWFEHWAAAGVKPVFLCEYAVPFSWDWGMYRGWYRGERAFGSAAVPWEFCLAEWNAQFLGDRAYRISPIELRNLRWEADQLRAGRVWHRWDYPHALGSSVFTERDPVFAEYLTDNWRAFRTWGVSAVSPWEYAIFWTARAGVDRGRKELPVDWERLQQPGFSPDYQEQRYERMDLAFEREDWVPTAAGRALLRNNGPLLAYLGGGGPPGRERFTSKDHNYLPGQVIEKQLVLINNSRRTVTAECRWTLSLPRPLAGRRGVTLRTGEQARIPLRLPLPASLPAGSYELRAEARFPGAETQEDVFRAHVLAPPAPAPRPADAPALYDPKGETAALLTALEIPFRRVEAGEQTPAGGLLILGRGALAPDGAGPDLARVRDGLRVLVFEQTAAALERRLGFRTAEYGLRRLFPRLPDHPVLEGLGPGHLRDWRGEATLLPPRLEYTLRPRHGPTVQWCGIDVSRLWRCGNRGNAASVLIEKPARGDFLPILDGGYSLQYSPLLEYREGRGMVLFCQADVTGRTEADPGAALLVRNLLAYAAAWKPQPRRRVLYAGEAAGRRHLEAVGAAPAPAAELPRSAEQLLVVGPGGAAELADRKREVARWIAAGGRVLAVGLDGSQARAFLDVPFRTEVREHAAAFFAPPARASAFAAVSPADVHNRVPRPVPMVTEAAEELGGVLARDGGGRVLFFQVPPWSFDPEGPLNSRRTFRRAAFAFSRMLGNIGADLDGPLLARFRSPAGAAEKRWLDGLYLDAPVEWDDPYRFFRW